MNRRKNSTDVTDTTDAPEEACDGCTTKRGAPALAALAVGGASPFLVGAAAAPNAHPSAVPTVAPTTAPTPGGILAHPGNIGDVLNQVAGAFPGHWFGLAGLGIVGATTGVFYLKAQAEAGRPRVVAGPKGEGFASPNELAEYMGEKELVARAPELRPSLANQRGVKISPLDMGLNVGACLIWKKQLYIACEDSVLIFSPPRSGKTAWLGGQVVDAAGACVVTSTRGDVYKVTHALRGENGRPIWVFNSDVEGIANTVRWNLVKGCDDPETAVRRAGHMLAASAKGEAMENQTFWDSHAFILLRNLLMAGALGGKNLLDVAAWVSDQTNMEPLKIMSENHHRIPQGWFNSLRQVMEVSDKTRDGVYMSLAPTLEFLSLPTNVDIVLPRPGEREFSAVELLTSQGTLYMMGEDKLRGSIAPLYSALVAEVYHEARAMAKRNGGRCDPYVRFVLDEAAIICPLPLHAWSTDAGGFNIQLLISVQSPSQLRDRWGHNGADTLWQNCNKLALGGLSVGTDLENLSMLVGDKDEILVATSTNKKTGEVNENRSLRRARVMPPADIRKMKPMTGLYFHRSAGPVRIQYVPVWKRKDVKAAVKTLKQQEKLHDQKMRETADLLPSVPVQARYSPPAYDVPPLPNYAPHVPQQPPVPVQRPAAAEEDQQQQKRAGGMSW